MLDFLKIEHVKKKSDIILKPSFTIKKSTDLMIRGGSFYAIWDESKGLWVTDEFEAIKLMDKEIKAEVDKFEKDGIDVIPLYFRDSESGSVDRWNKYLNKQMIDNFHPLDKKVIFSNDEIRKEDYASKRLDYPLVKAETPAYDKIIGTLYSEEERHKIEWAIGAIISGDSIWIQKFIVLYGDSGTGKSTILNIIQDLFKGYYSVFSAKALGSRSDVFALEAFESNPLIAIEHDGDLSHIEDNTRLNSLVSHEEMTINAKFKSLYSMRFGTFLFMGTNRPVRITDAKSGILRRLIDVSPTGNKLSLNAYNQLTSQVKFELGGIAYHCLEVYKEDPGFYNNYIPTKMMGASNDFFNFMLEMYDLYEQDDIVTLNSSWDSYLEYCSEAKVQYPFSKRQFKEELKAYFEKFEERQYLDNGTRVRNLYSGFKTSKFEENNKPHVERAKGIKFEEQDSLLDSICANFKAQYSNEDGTPEYRWDNVKTKLKDIDTHKLHYLRLPTNHIVIDFDLKDKDGNKSFAKNLEAANKWPETYAELSKSGEGIHLHYIYDGDVDQLSRLYSEDIEVKVFNGKSSLRRKLTKCNDHPITTINSGLPVKGDSKMVNFDVIKSENGLRRMIVKNLKKEIHPATKPSVDFIYKILEDAYASSMIYDVSDMKPSVISFGANSTNHAEYCLKLINKMHFKSEEQAEANKSNNDKPIIFYDVEVFPNLFVIIWKGIGSNPVKMINPTKEEVEELVQMRLVGFNCRRYDNHILYAAMMGYNNEQLYRLSQKIINSGKGNREGFFSEAYNLSYTDIYDYAATKQSLKKWEIELGIHHQELGLPWDQPVPESLWETVADYCINDVVATEATWNATQGDFTARQILAELSGLSENDTTNSHTTRIIFGKEKHPDLVYTDLSEVFPGYEYIENKNIYRGVDVGKGGYVYANPGMYRKVITFDVASMHPSSVIAMNCFGKYTQRFKDLLDIRIAIKHKDFDKARNMLDGKLAPYLDDPAKAKALAQALKIAINSVYGLTSASFDNPFRDSRNVNNIVALRGALFMKTLQDELESKGIKVVHIKTDSIKIVDPDEKTMKFVLDFGKKYGYNFEVEHVFEKICLVNDAVYIAKLAEDDPEDPGKWTATGAQFQQPYIFKTLFSKEPIEFEDMCEVKSVTKGDIYLDFNEELPEDEHNYIFVGRIGQFCPMVEGINAGILYRCQDDKYYAVTGTKGYRWMESEVVKKNNLVDKINIEYYQKLVDDAIDSINEYGDIEEFVD